MAKKIILSPDQIQKILTRVCFEIYEKCLNDSNVVLVGISSKGYLLSQRIQQILQNELNWSLPLVKITPSTDGFILDHSIDLNHATIVLIDDVLNTGKTLMYAAQSILEHPIKKLYTVVLVDREHRDFPIQASIYGQRLATTIENHIEVVFEGDTLSAYLN